MVSGTQRSSSHRSSFRNLGHPSARSSPLLLLLILLWPLFTACSNASPFIDSAKIMAGGAVKGVKVGKDDSSYATEVWSWRFGAPGDSADFTLVSGG